MEAGPLRVSVIVPAWNAAATLARSLTAIQAQLGPDDEVLVVDDGSTDDTRAVAERLGARCIGDGEQRGVAAARNRGALAARGEVLLFTDADAALAPGALERACARVLGGSDAVVGLYTADCDARDPVSRYKNLWIRYTYLRSAERIEWLFGCLFAMRRALFLELAGFREELSRNRGGSDIELGLRMRERGLRIDLDKQLEVRHFRRHTLGGLLANDLRRCAGYTTLGLESLGYRRLLRTRRFANIPPSFVLGVAALGALLAVGALALAGAAPAWLALAPAALYLALNLGTYAYLARHGGPLVGAIGPALLAGSQLACLIGLPYGLLRTAATILRDVLHGVPASPIWRREGRWRRRLASLVSHE